MLTKVIAAIVALAFLAVGAGIGNRHNEYTYTFALLSGLRAAEWGLAASSLSTTYCVLANPTNREDGRHWAGHLPM